MDVISFNEAATANDRIYRFNANPDSDSGLVSLPKKISVGESVTIPKGRVVVHPNLEIDGTLTIEDGGELFVPFGGTLVSSDLMHPVDTIADLRNETGKYKYVYVTGYHTKDDGAFGSNMFVWDENSTETDNGGTIIKCTTVTSGRYKLKYTGAINVKWFGAKGDNSTDDTSAIQSALNADLGSILFIDGVYIVSNLQIVNDVVLFGNGTLKRKNNSATYILSSINTNCTLELNGLTIDGNNTNQVFPLNKSDIRVEQDGDVATSITHKIINCTFINPSKHSIYMRGQSNLGRIGFILDNCTFMYGEAQTASDGVEYVTISGRVNPIVSNCLFDYGSDVSVPLSPPTALSVTQGGAPVDFDNGGELLITNCKFRRVGRGQSNALGALSLYSCTANVNISNLTFEDCYVQALELKAYTKNMTVSNIIIDKVYGMGTYTATGLAIEGSNVLDNLGKYTIAKNAVISNCVISNVEGNAMMIESSDPLLSTGYFENLILDNIVIDNCSGVGIRTAYIKDIFMSNLIIKKVGTVGIRLFGITGRCTISNSYIEAGKVDGVSSAISTISASSCDLSILDTECVVPATAPRCAEIQSNRSIKLIGSKFTGASGTDIRLGNYTSHSFVRDCIADKFTYTGTKDNLVVESIKTTRITPESLVISSGVVYAVESLFRVDTEGGAATDDLVTIAGGYLGRVIHIRTTDSGRDVVVKHNVGNIKTKTSADITMSNIDQSISFVYDGAYWVNI